MTRFSPFYPDTAFSGVAGTALPATRNVNLGDWNTLPVGTTLNTGDIVQYLGSSFMVNATHTKTAGTAVPPSNSNYTLLAQSGSNGQTTYSWFAFADSADGTVNFTTGVGGTRAYIGVANNQSTPVESTNPADYQWTKIQGPGAKLLYIASDRQLITYDGTGALSPSTQTTTFTIYPQNLSTGTYTISMYRADNTVINANTYLTAVNGTFAASSNNISWSGSGTQFTLTAANFDAARGSTNGVIVFINHADGVSDSITIVKAAAGANGVNGTNAKTIYISSDRQLISYDSTGALNPTTQTTVFTISAQNLSSGTYTLSLSQADGTVVNANTYLTALNGTFTASGNNITWSGSGTQFQLTGPNFNTARGSTAGLMVAVSHSDGVSDRINILRQQAGATGPQGPGGPVVAVSANDLSFDYVDNIPVDSTQTITVTATLQNTSETINWSSSPAVTLGAPSGTQRTLTITNFGTNLAVTITATGATSGATSSITLIRNNMPGSDDSLLADSDFTVSSALGTNRPWRGNGTFRTVLP